MLNESFPQSYYRCIACEQCSHSGRTGMECKKTGNAIKNECGFPDLHRPGWCPYNTNCHEYCHYRKQCRYAKGETGLIPEECAMYWKIDDIIAEARDVCREQEDENDD